MARLKSGSSGERGYQVVQRAEAAPTNPTGPAGGSVTQVTPEQDAILRSSTINRPKLRALLGDVSEDQYRVIKKYYVFLRHAARVPGAGSDREPRTRNRSR